MSYLHHLFYLFLIFYLLCLDYLLVLTLGGWKRYTGLSALLQLQRRPLHRLGLQRRPRGRATLIQQQILMRKIRRGWCFMSMTSCFTSSWCRCVDGKNCVTSAGAKTFNIFAGLGEHRLFPIVLKLYTHSSKFCSRFALPASTPIYWWWYYFLIYKCVVKSLGQYLPRFPPANNEEVDQRLEM
jgi:hypothetical protein